jgi:hypothetical protein
VADAEPIKRFIGAVAGLLRALPDAAPLPDSVMSAADEVRQAVAALGGKDVGPPPGEITR